MRIRANVDLDPAVEALRERMRLRVEPALVFMTGSGDILRTHYARLYPAYNAGGRVLPGWSETLLDVEGVLALVDDVEAAWRAEEASIRALRERGDSASAVALARIQADRGWPERARALLEGALGSGEDVRAREALAALLEETAGAPEARKQYEELIRRHAGDARGVRWRNEVARLRLREAFEQEPADPSIDPQVLAARTRLKSLAYAVQDEALAIRMRLVLARAAQQAGDATAFMDELTWLASRTGGDETSRAPWTAPMLLELIQLEFRPGEETIAEAARHGRQLARTFPDSCETQIAKHGMLGGTMQFAGPLQSVDPGD